MKSISFRFIGMTLGVCLFSALAANAQSIISENWEEDSVGSSPALPWTTYTGSPAGSLGSVTVSDSIYSSFDGGDQSIFLNGTSGGGVALNRNFAATTSALSISFDFYLSNAAVLPTFTLASSTGVNGLQLNLANSFNQSGNYIVNQTAGGGVGTTLAPSATGIWFHVDIVTSAATGSGETYSITITPANDTATSFSGLTFRNQISDFGGLSFAWNSTNGVGGMYVDNIVVSAIPEPATFALLFALAAIGFASVRIYKKRA